MPASAVNDRRMNLVDAVWLMMGFDACAHACRRSGYFRKSTQCGRGLFKSVGEENVRVLGAGIVQELSIIRQAWDVDRPLLWKEGKAGS